MNISLNINNKIISAQVPPTTRLSQFLRDNAGLSATKVGCDAGDCGACTVIQDGKILCSCICAVGQCEGTKITTLEGLQDDEITKKLYESFLKYGASQCGICTPAMMVSAVHLLRHNPHPSCAQVKDAMGGVLCRCTGYNKIILAIQHALSPLPFTPSSAKNLGIVGAEIPAIDGHDKICGISKFGADKVPDNALFVRVIRSPYHHGEFTIGDTTDFLQKNPKIIKILTAKDVIGENKFGVIAPFADQPVFAERKAIFKGEAIACVIGTKSAVQNLNPKEFPVIWRELPAVLNPNQAMQEYAPILHKNRAKNILVKGYVARGNLAKGLEKSLHQAKASFTTPFIEHAYIEPEAGYAVRQNNRITIFGCTQAPHMDKEAIAKIMGLDESAVQIIPSACGGGFGSKLDISMQPYIALAAWHTNQPCAIIYTRTESMQSTTKRHPSEITTDIACDAKGKITYFDFYGKFNTGAYASWGPTVANRVPIHASGPYYIPNYRAESLAIHTNCAPSGAFRGFGVPQSAVAVESVFDMLAEKCQISPWQFRYINALSTNKPTATGQKFTSGVGIKQCLLALRKPYNQAKKRAEKFNAHSKILKKGVGIGTCWYGCGNTSMANPSEILIGINAKGEIYLHQGAVDIGQGSNTIMAQIAAQSLGIEFADIKLISADTDLTPDAGKTSASRQTFVTGNAVRLASLALRKQILQLVNDNDGANDDAKISLENGKIIVKGTINHEISLAKLPINANNYVIFAQESYDPPTKPLDANGQGEPYALYGYGAQVMELTINTALGTIKLDKLTTAHDVGQAINPILVEGQIEGGSTQGIGFALMEEFIPARTENLHDYLIPSFGDVPEFANHIIEVADKNGPFGAKGLGEHVLIPTAPAILNAIYDACQVRITDLPATPDKILAKLKELKHG